MYANITIFSPLVKKNNICVFIREVWVHVILCDIVFFGICFKGKVILCTHNVHVHI